MTTFNGFRDHEAAEEKASAETLAFLRPMLVGTPWKLRWQHTGGGCSAWELYASGDLNAVTIYLTGGEGNDSSARIDETGMLVGAIGEDGCEFPGLDYVETDQSLTPQQRAKVVVAYLKRAERAVPRIMESVSAAQDAFFAALAQKWPEAKTGEMYPHEAIKFQDAAFTAASAWISASVSTSTLSVSGFVTEYAISGEVERVLLSDGSWL